MKMAKLLILISLPVVLLFVSCSGFKEIVRSKEAGGAGAETGNPLYLNIIWHQHQPLYSKDPATGIYTRPWVRVHATKDYYDMVQMLEKYPKVKVTFNLTPVLIKQLDDYKNGARDIYWVLAEKPASSLTESDKRFILRRFFDANYKNLIGKFPGYTELLKKRGGASDAEIDSALKSYSVQDFRDLQVLFNLAWFDPDFLSQAPLNRLVEKGKGFSEADKKLLFKKVRDVIDSVIPEYKKLLNKGRIEVITTPYAHPILPLIYNSDLAKIGDPGVKLPKRFSYPQDAIGQLRLSVSVYEKHYDRKPVGLWPAEGAVAQPIVKLVADAGYKWMASGQQVLAKSLGIGSFTRSGRDLVDRADDLYRPYYVSIMDGRKVGIVFRDNRLSDLIGFEYSGTSGEQAADDFMNRLESIREKLKSDGAKGPHLVSVILDGENAWEYYHNDGKAFLNGLYHKLSESRTIITITVTDYLKKFPDQRTIKNLWPGAWFSPDYATWIGEPEENEAWDYLGKVRKHLAQFDMYKKRTAPKDKLDRAFDFMYLAEGSDWFWWYGKDQDSGDDSYFDANYRFLLKNVYTTLGDPVPDFLTVPIIPKSAVKADRNITDLSKVKIDGRVSAGEWEKACYYGIDNKYVKGFYAGFDVGNLYFRIDFKSRIAAGTANGAQIYFSTPSQKDGKAFTPALNGDNREKVMLDFRAGYFIEISPAETENNSGDKSGGEIGGKTSGKFGGETGTINSGYKIYLWAVGKYGQWEKIAELKNTGINSKGNLVEIGIPFSYMGDIEAGDSIKIQAVLHERSHYTARFPAKGPALCTVPELGTSEVILKVRDPIGDDHGPGSYVYATDKVFKPSVFDAEDFIIAQNEKYLIFKIKIHGPLENPWGSGIKLSLQTFDIYIDEDPGKGTGARKLLEGRNAALKKGDGWEYAVWVEGWEQKLLKPDKSGKPVEVSGTPVKIIVDSKNRTVTVKVLKDALGKKGKDIQPSKWGYACALLSQEGFPSPGVRRVRDVKKTAEQWRMGGAPDDTNHTRIVDLIWPKGEKPAQEEILSKYPVSHKTAADSLPPDAFAQIPLLNVK